MASHTPQLGPATWMQSAQRLHGHLGCLSHSCGHRERQGLKKKQVGSSVWCSQFSGLGFIRRLDGGDPGFGEAGGRGI